jgi:nicotinamide-nucleotide amidase
MDDVTVEAIAQATARQLVYVPRVAKQIRAFYRVHRRRLNHLALRQASVPFGAIALPNPVGTAPGLWLPLDGSLLVALPGVPQEMRAIMERSVLSRLRQRAGRFAIISRTIRTVGLVELEIQAVLRRLAIPPSVQVGLYPHLGAVDIRLTVARMSPRKARRILDALERTLRRHLRSAIYGIDEQTLEGVVGEALMRRRLTLAIAESCTGGLVSDRITNVPGSSRYFLVSVIAYDNQMKETLLGVTPSLLSRYGAVSAPVAKAMAQGVRRLGCADVGLAITGIAGPSGGSSKKPVGLVYLALADRTITLVKRCHFHGDRLAIKSQASQAALDLLRRRLLR